MNMNIRDMVRKALLTEGKRTALLKEGSHNGNNYSCIMVFLKYEQSEWDIMQDLIDDDDLYEPKDETGFGKEDHPHVTILFGLHEDISDKDIEDEIKKIKNPKLKLGKVSSFTNENFDVLKFDIESEDLYKYNKNFSKFPNTTEFKNYHPHCTIAYVKSGLAKKYIDK